MQVLCVCACVHNAILDKTDTQPTSLIIRYATHAKKHRYSVFFYCFCGWRIRLCTANGKSGAFARYDPDTNKSAPASQHNCAVLSFMPPSTDIVNFRSYFLRVALSTDILCSAAGSKD